MGLLSKQLKEDIVIPAPIVLSFIELIFNHVTRIATRQMIKLHVHIWRHPPHW
jgi:hypothetical protein